MPTLTINGTEYHYDEQDVICFPEGLIGLPQIRQAVVVSISEFAPFCWLAPLDTPSLRFVVVDPNEIFSGYEPAANASYSGVKTYSLVTLSSDWAETTFNLKAPILVDTERRTAAQHILTNSPYHFAERLPQGQ